MNARFRYVTSTRRSRRLNASSWGP
jgi:hypothetical protein